MPVRHESDAGDNGMLHAGKIQSFELWLHRVEGSFLMYYGKRASSEIMKRRAVEVHQSRSPECNGYVCDAKTKHLFFAETLKPHHSSFGVIQRLCTLTQEGRLCAFMGRGINSLRKFMRLNTKQKSAGN